MKSAPLAIPGVPWGMTVDVNAWTGKRRLFVGDAEVPTKRGAFEFPAPNGMPVKGQIKPMRIWETYPKIDVGGVIYPTGPEAPIGLKIAALLPIVLFAGGLIGILCGGVAVLTNFAVIRSGVSRGAAITTCVLTLLIAAVVVVVAAGLITFWT